MSKCNYENCPVIMKRAHYCNAHTALIKRQERKGALILMLGGECIQCGSEELLEFDHINPDEKLFNIADGLARRWESILEEIEKCQLLCRECHIGKSAVQLDYRAVQQEYI